MKTHSILNRIALLATPCLLAGCMAAALTPLVSGTLDNSAKVIIDEKTLTPELRAAFSSAKSLAVVAGDRASVKAADLFETRGGYVVTIDRPTAKNGEMTGSERRDALRRLCTKPHPDLAMLGRVTKTESNNTVIAALTGRSTVKNDWTMEVLDCRFNTPHIFGGTLEFDVGNYNNKQAEIEDISGTEIGTKILDVLGRAKTDIASNPGSESSMKVRQSKNSGKNPEEKTDSRAAPMATIDIQKRLTDSGYLRGKPDGVFGKNTSDALKKFQEKNGLPVTGKPDNETIAILSSAQFK